MTKPIKIAIAEDHKLFREGLSALLNEDDQIKLQFDVSDGEQLLEGLKDHKVDIVLLDLNMPVLNGQQTLKLLNKRHPKIRSIVLSMHDTGDYILETIKLGARGFLPKHCDIEKVIDAIYAVQEQGY